MSTFSNFIVELCDEMIKLKPDWEDCSTCGPIIPYLRENKDTKAITPTKLRIRSLMREMKIMSPEKYKFFNDRFRSLEV